MLLPQLKDQMKTALLVKLPEKSFNAIVDCLSEFMAKSYELGFMTHKKLKPEIDKLMESEGYCKHCEYNFHKLQEFMKTEEFPRPKY